MFLISLAYSLTSTQSTSHALFFITPVLPIVRLVTHCQNNKSILASFCSFLLVLASLVSVIHTISQSHYSFHLHRNETGKKEAYKNPIPSMFSLLILTLVAILPVFVPELHSQIHPSISTLYLALSMTLISPAIILADYSIRPEPYIVTPM